LRQVLRRTLGVPLFQEQAMRIAIVAAGFTGAEANQLRRAMASFRHEGTIHRFRTKLVEGMVARNYTRDFAERCFAQIEGFGDYGFPESHAASFAKLVYVSAWLKCHHPASFACALLNSQPMGFYAPAQIVRDAREHGVSLRAVDVNASAWDCLLEDIPGEATAALRLGLRQISGFRQDWAEALVARRSTGFPDFPALVRTGLPAAALAALADADAMRSLGLDRRQALWKTLPLLANLPIPDRKADLPHMGLAEHVIADYQSLGLSLKAHPLRFLRESLTRENVQSCAETTASKDGARVRTAGVVLVRQRPGNANVVFATIEDETGTANVVIWPNLQDRFRREILSASLLVVGGVIQRSPEGVVHLIAETLEDRSAALHHLEDAELIAPSAETPSVPTALTRSRDFH
jgi:error-prone DNA polymerase